MSRVCQITGKRRNVAHKVSHSNRKTKRRFNPNLCEVTLASDALGRSFRFRITAAALRSVDHVGGLDAFLIKAREETLSASARKVRKDVKKKLADLPGVEVRGAGCLIGVQSPLPSRALRDGLLQRGLLVGVSGEPNTLRLLPPYTIDDRSLHRFVEAVHEVLRG